MEVALLVVLAMLWVVVMGAEDDSEGKLSACMLHQKDDGDGDIFEGLLVKLRLQLRDNER